MLGAAFLYIASLPGPFYPRHAKPDSRPIPLWKARTFIVAFALWMLFGALWIWRRGKVIVSVRAWFPQLT